jgi:hypothetical protein
MTRPAATIHTVQDVVDAAQLDHEIALTTSPTENDRVLRVVEEAIEQGLVERPATWHAITAGNRYFDNHVIGVWPPGRSPR